MSLKIHQRLRYARPYSPTPPEIDGLPNYFHETDVAGRPMATLDAGITPLGKVAAVDGLRTPAILIRSSPHKSGSQTTPWQDFFDPDNGHIRYFGDNKPGKVGGPEAVRGNRELLNEFVKHTSFDPALRSMAVPLIFFLGVPHQGRVKGQVSFQGFGVIQRSEVVAQWDSTSGTTFPNYMFEFVVLSLAAENEEFDWDWIGRRQDPSITVAETLKAAPHAWKTWVAEGAAALEKSRRRVAKLKTLKALEQRPIPGSREEQVLHEVYHFYDGQKHHFEALAEVVTERVLTASGATYKMGWITPASGDHGADFIGRIDVGTGFARTKLVVLGQAKCEKLSLPTSGRHIARTVARLRRGWVGAYVTTSYFSEPVQEEVIEDEYPIVLIHGLQLAQVVLELLLERGMKATTPLLEEIDSKYLERITFRRPSEILLD